MDLVELDEYKEYKQLTNVEQDAKRTALIVYVSQLVESYCNRKFIEYASSPGITEYYSALTNRVYVDQFPIINVYSVEVSSDGGQTYTALVENSSEKDGYIVDVDNGVIMTQLQYKSFLSYCDLEYNSFKVSYTAGYEELPKDLKLAIFDLIHYYEKEEMSLRKSLMGAQLENPLPFNDAEFPSHIQRILSLYRAPVAEDFSFQFVGS